MPGPDTVADVQLAGLLAAGLQSSGNATTQLSFRHGLTFWILFIARIIRPRRPHVEALCSGKLSSTSDAADYCATVHAPIDNNTARSCPGWPSPFTCLPKGESALDPALFGMLMANSILTASTSIVIILIGLRIGVAYSTSLLAVMLFLVIRGPQHESRRLRPFRRDIFPRDTRLVTPDESLVPDPSLSYSRLPLQGDLRRLLPHLCSSLVVR